MFGKHTARRPSDVETGDPWKRIPRRSGLLRLVIAVLGVLFVLHAGFGFSFSLNRGGPSSSDLSPDILAFADTPRPSWIDNPVKDPLVLRIAIISRAAEFDRRQAFRESVLAGIRDTDVQFEYRFFVGAVPDGLRGSITSLQITQENRKHRDIVVLGEIPDVISRLSEKRFAALKWGGSMPSDTYDYFMTMDSDTFCRFNTMARWMPILLKDEHFNPREDPVMIGRMGNHLTYFQNTVPDGNKNASDEDEFVKGPWFKYPMGVGYMLSSSLVKTMLSVDPPLPHHVHYPSDDVMIGAWVAGLRYFPDKSIKFETTEEHSPPPVHEVTPKPYLPYIVDTKIIDDTVGWHDPPGRSGNDGKISWNSVCTHRLTTKEMIAMRAIKEFQGEWSSED